MLSVLIRIFVQTHMHVSKFCIELKWKKYRFFICKMLIITSWTYQILFSLTYYDWIMGAYKPTSKHVSEAYLHMINAFVDISDRAPVSQVVKIKYEVYLLRVSNWYCKFYGVLKRTPLTPFLRSMLLFIDWWEILYFKIQYINYCEC